MENIMSKKPFSEYPIILESEKLDIFFDWLTPLCYNIEPEKYIIKDFILNYISPRTKNFPIQLRLHSYEQFYIEDNNGYKKTKSRWLYTIQKDSIKLLSDIPIDYHFYTINDLLEMSIPTIQEPEPEPIIDINQQILNKLNENENQKIVELGNIVDSIL
jgi:hypothetical protein